MATNLKKGTALGSGPQLSGSPFAACNVDNPYFTESCLLVGSPQRSGAASKGFLTRKSSSFMASLRRLSSALGLGKSKKSKDLDSRSMSQHQPTQARSVHGGSVRPGNRSPICDVRSSLHSASTGVAFSRQATNLTNGSPMPTFTSQAPAAVLQGPARPSAVASPSSALSSAIRASPPVPGSSLRQLVLQGAAEQDGFSAQQSPSALPSASARGTRMEPISSEQLSTKEAVREYRNGINRHNSGQCTVPASAQLEICLSAPSKVTDILTQATISATTTATTQPDRPGPNSGANSHYLDGGGAGLKRSKPALTVDVSTPPPTTTTVTVAPSSSVAPPSSCQVAETSEARLLATQEQTEQQQQQRQQQPVRQPSVPLPPTPPQQMEPLSDAQAVPERPQPEPTNLLAMSKILPPGMRRPAWSIDDYSITRRLFKGARTAVYKATCKHSNAPVALKVYFLSKVPGNTLHQIAREIQIHAGLHHRNILALYGAFQDSKRLVLVTELASRGDLHKLHAAMDRLTESQVRRVVLEPLLDSLSYLHGRGVCHRDIKPENILFTSEWEFRLADFGVSINLLEERAVTRAGTADYMAPEVERCPLKSCPEDNKDNLSLAYSTAADVWSVGVLAYELLVGFPPLVADKAAGACSGGGLRGFSAASLSFPASVSAPARDFITSALAGNPAERPTARQLRSHPWLLAAAAEGGSNTPGGSGGEASG